MDNIITELFTSSNHELIVSEKFRFFKLIDKYNYWLVIERDNLSEVINEQIDFFLEAKELIGERQFDKNANLLILHKVENLEQANKDTILEIEEDLYHFKKSIIYYTQDELEGLESRVSQFDLRINIESLI